VVTTCISRWDGRSSFEAGQIDASPSNKRLPPLQGCGAFCNFMETTPRLAQRCDDINSPCGTLHSVNVRCLFAALCSLGVLANSPVLAKTAKDRSVVMPTPKQGPVRTDLTPGNRNDCLAVAQTLNEQAKRLSQQKNPPQGVLREFTRVAADLGHHAARRTSKRHGSASSGRTDASTISTKMPSWASVQEMKVTPALSIHD
jgi:hypothetical protein